MATNSFVIDPQQLEQAKVYAKAAAEENIEFYERMGKLIERMYVAIDGIESHMGREGFNNQITNQRDNLSNLQKRFKENSQRAEKLCDMIQMGLDQGEITEQGLAGMLQSMTDFLMDALGFFHADTASQPEGQVLGATKAVAVSGAALAGTFGLVQPAAFTSLGDLVNRLLQGIRQKIQEIFPKGSGAKIDGGKTNTSEKTSSGGQSGSAETANPNLKVYGGSKCNWSPKAGGKANDYSDYSVVKGFDERYVLYQRDYYNGSVACTSTSDAIVGSIVSGKLLEPGKSYWKGGQCSWPNTKEIPNTKHITVDQQCQIICENVQNGNPVILRVPNHSVVAVGIKNGVDPSAATPADILIIDPGDGKVKTADEIYSGWYDGTGKLSMKDNIGWSLRVAK